MRRKRAIASLLTLSLWSLPLHAAESEYLVQARLLKQAIDQLASYQYQVKFSQAILTEQLFTAGMVEFLNRELRSSAQGLEALEAQRTKIQEGLKSIAVSSFMTLNQDLMAWTAERAKVVARLNQIEKAGLAILARESFFERFCSVYPHLVRSDALVYQPLNFGIGTGLDYTKYSTVFTGGGTSRQGGWIFSQDPKVEAETVLGSSATALLALGTISAIYGVLPTSFLTLQLLADGSVTVGTSIALGGSSAGAGATAEAGAAGAGTALTVAAVVIVLAAIAYSEWKTDKENKKREKEAKKKYEAELGLFNEAQSWYNNNRLTGDQLVSMAQGTCGSEKTQKTLGEYKKQFDAQFSTSIKALFDQLRITQANLAETEGNLKAGVEQYEKELSKLLTAEAMDSLRQESLDAQEVSAIWLVFNEQIKPLLDQHLQRSIKEGCRQGAENWPATELALKLSLDQIAATVDPKSPRLEEAWGEVQKRTQRMQSVLQKRLTGCPSTGGNIYDF